MTKRQFAESTKRNSDKLFTKRRKKAIPKPSAQSTTLLQPAPIKDINLTALYSNYENNRLLSRSDLAVIELLMFYGLRISEVLRIGQRDILNNGYIRITGSKGSNDRMIYPSKNSSYWQNTLKQNLPLSNTYSRFYYYRLFKRLGIYERFSGRKNSSVTHLFRQKLLREFKTNNIAIDLRAQFIGHKSTKSTKHYE